MTVQGSADRTADQNRVIMEVRRRTGKILHRKALECTVQE